LLETEPAKCEEQEENLSSPLSVPVKQGVFPPALFPKKKDDERITEWRDDYGRLC
jgi:hypothetical protein